jgi:hypothetical protein
VEEEEGEEKKRRSKRREMERQEKKDWRCLDMSSGRKIAGERDHA